MENKKVERSMCIRVYENHTPILWVDDLKVNSIENILKYSDIEYEQDLCDVRIQIGNTVIYGSGRIKDYL